jgi:hypothetical protein
MFAVPGIVVTIAVAIPIPPMVAIPVMIFNSYPLVRVFVVVPILTPGRS